MPHSSTIQTDRQKTLREILANGPAQTQQALVDQLVALGFDATQSCVSRDLKDVRAIKTNAGYELPSVAADAAGAVEGVADLVRSLATAGANLLVIKTAIGGAQRVALALDRSHWPEIVGNIGGDDTVFTATESRAAQRNLISKIERAVARA